MTISTARGRTCCRRTCLPFSSSSFATFTRTSIGPAFFFADIHADIDWARAYQSLDKEFQQIIRRAKVGKGLADKLFKVWLRGGEERWLLIHVEVQGERETEFPRRIFDYDVAIRRLYNKTVVSLAVLCDDDPAWLPTTFEDGTGDVVCS